MLHFRVDFTTSSGKEVFIPIHFQKHTKSPMFLKKISSPALRGNVREGVFCIIFQNIILIAAPSPQSRRGEGVLDCGLVQARKMDFSGC
jgi:hypothetical protein